MSNKTKEEIEQLAELAYPVKVGGLMWMPNNSDIDKAKKQEGYIKGYTQCQETLNAKIVELEKKVTNWQPISEINELNDSDLVCFVEMYMNDIVKSEFHDFKWFKTNREYDVNNFYTHFTKLPKI